MNLLMAGIYVAEPNELGTDRRRAKRPFATRRNVSDKALVSRCGRELAVKIGSWGIEMLRDLPAFYLDGEIFRLTPSAWELIDDELLHSIQNNAKLSPLTIRQFPGPKFRTGGLPDDLGQRAANTSPPSVNREGRALRYRRRQDASCFRCAQRIAKRAVHDQQARSGLHVVRGCAAAPKGNSRKLGREI